MAVMIEVPTPVLVYLNEIKDYLTVEVYNNLKNSDRYLNIERAAAFIARDVGGLTLPEYFNSRPDWIMLPMAWIISYLVSPNLIMKNLENDTSNTNFLINYNKAIDIIRMKVGKASSTGSNIDLSTAGLTSGAFTWL